MDAKKISEQVIEALRGDIEREVEKRLAAEKSISDEPDDLGFTEFERAAVKYTCSFLLTFGAEKRAEYHKSTQRVYHPCANKLHALHLIFKNKSVEQLTAAIEAYRKDPDRFMRGVKVDMTA